MTSYKAPKIPPMDHVRKSASEYNAKDMNAIFWSIKINIFQADAL